MTRPARVVLAAAALAAATLLLTPLVGSTALDPQALLQGHEPDVTIFWTLRLPRVLLAALTGATLAASGATFQTLLRNDLASPFTLGVASGASLGASLAIFLGLHATQVLGPAPLPLAAFLGAAAVIAAILGLVRARGPRMDTPTLLLAGVTLSFLASALLLLLHFAADFTATHRMLRWTMGGLDTVGYQAPLTAAPLALLGTLTLLAHIPTLDQLLAGDLLAASRGIPVRHKRLLLLLAASLATASVIAFTGPIGFVGLIVPHAARRAGAVLHRHLLPASLLGGAALLPACDAVARTLFAPAELPVGVLTALLGAPVFLLILLRNPRP